jgi:hypothetical protein
MRRFLIHGVNFALLSTILIGIPIIAGTHLGSLQISSTPVTRRLMLWGLALAGAGNALVALGAVKDRCNRRSCRYWALVFVGLLLVVWAVQQGYLNFNWLKQMLLWFKQHF